MPDFENKKKWLWLSLSCKISKSKMIKLYDRFGSIDNIFDAEREDYEKLSFLNEADIGLLLNKGLDFSNEYLSVLNKKKISVITRDDAYFPETLFDIPNHPSLIYVKGKIRPLKKDECISIVGSRTPQGYGKNITTELSTSLARAGLTIVSGMADGVDTLSHRGALNAGGFTVAVLGCGVDFVYPKGNFELYEKICERGMIISEYPLGTRPERFYFPERNKIVAALSLATLVTEANLKSGSLITADAAKKYGRRIFSVPGNITSSFSGGTNELIRCGASVVTSADDILSFYEKENMEASQKSTSPKLEPNEALIFEALRKREMTIDELSYHTSLSFSELNSVLLFMELKNIIKKSGADRYCIILK